MQFLLAAVAQPEKLLYPSTATVVRHDRDLDQIGELVGQGFDAQSAAGPWRRSGLRSSVGLVWAIPGPRSRPCAAEQRP